MQTPNGSLQSHMFQRVSKLSSSSSGEIWQVRWFLSRSTSLFHTLLCHWPAIRSGMFVQCTRAPCMRKRCHQAVMASHVSMDTNVRGIYSWSCLHIYRKCTHLTSVQQATFSRRQEKGIILRFKNGECTGNWARRTRSLCSEERTHHSSCWSRHLEGRLRYRSLCSDSHHRGIAACVSYLPKLYD